MLSGGMNRPLARRQRIFTRQRRRSSRGWIAGGVAVAAVAFVWLWAFQRGPDTTAGTVPVLRADNKPMRVKPSDPGGMKVSTVDPLADENAGAPATEHLLPPPETPLPRPSPVTSASAATGPDQAAAATVSRPADSATAGQIAPPVIAVSATMIPAPAAPPPAQPAIPALVAHAPAAAALAAPGAGGYRLQLASLRSAADAKQTWNHLKQNHPAILGGLEVSVVQVELGERGTFYRVVAGPMTAEAASFACDALKQRGAACILVKP
jgi:cell division septation protein DedD